MDKDELKRIVQNPDMIPGVYNYCDRWCQRCPMTSRCSVFAIEESDTEAKPESSDLKNEAFWQRLHDMFSVTGEMISEWAQENNIDLDVEFSPEEAAVAEKVDEQTEDNELMRAARKYQQGTTKWCTAMQPVFEEKIEQAEEACEAEFPEGDPEAEVWELADILDIIMWYHTLILAKMHRAVHQVIERELTGMDDETGDSDGSAKVVLISLDRSLAAWAALRKHLPEQEDTILDFLVQLERLRRRTEEFFPKARAFVRPGFDKPRS